MERQVNLKIWPKTLPKLRLLYALTGESMVSIIDRLVTQELQKIQDENRQDLQIQALPSEKE
jgi:hypothetical protein